MKSFNVTAQVYKKDDPTKQTILINNVVLSDDAQYAIDIFKLNISTEDLVLVKILSVEEVFQDAG